MGTSKPYTGAMGGIEHEPQVNLGADKKFSPVIVFKQKKRGGGGDKPWDFNGLIKRLHCHHSKMVKWLNQTEHTLWGSSWRDLQKDRIRLHELSPLSKGQSICVFQKNQNHKIGKECHEHCTTFHYIALFHMKFAFTKFHGKGCMHQQRYMTKRSY